MIIRKKLAFCLLLTTMTGSLLSGCVTTLPEQANTIDPEVYEQRNLEIAAGYLQNGLPARAIVRLEDILKKNSDSARAYGMLGVVYQSQGELALAERNFRRSLSINSKASDIRNNYGVLLFEMGRYKEARKEFLKVTDDIYYEQRSRAFENLGTVEQQLGDTKASEGYYRRALRLNSRLPRASLELTQLFLDQGNYVEAERFFNNFLDITRHQRPTARSLWLGIQLARVFKDQSALGQYVDKLKRYYPGSQEYREYQASSNND